MVEELWYPGENHCLFLSQWQLSHVGGPGFKTLTAANIQANIQGQDTLVNILPLESALQVGVLPGVLKMVNTCHRLYPG